MPRTLRNRLRPDSIAEFRAAAHERLIDGEAALAHDRRTVAIYLYGYCAEMILKAAFFSLAGFGDRQEIRFTDLQGARQAGINYGIAWPPSNALHNVQAWAELLVRHRSSLILAPPHPIEMSRQIRRAGRDVFQTWIVTLRYHPNRAYLYEVDRTKRAATWLLENQHRI